MPVIFNFFALAGGDLHGRFRCDVFKKLKAALAFKLVAVSH